MCVCASKRCFEFRYLVKDIQNVCGGQREQIEAKVVGKQELSDHINILNANQMHCLVTFECIGRVQELEIDTLKTATSFV